MNRALANVLATAVLACISVFACSQQQTSDPSGTSPQAATQPQQPSAQTGTTGNASQQGSATADDSQAQNEASSDGDAQKPGAVKRLKRHLRDQISNGCVNAIGNHCWDKPPADDQGGDPKKQQPQQSAANNAPPRSDQPTQGGQSSSRSTKIDLSPPAGEAAAPGVGVDPAEADVREFKPWDPHKADKNVEVGDFYFKRGNYRAAVSRYEEALYWKDDDATAMFRLGQAQEKLGEYSEARKNYAGYLKILPEGEFAGDANKALERIKNKADQPVAAVRR